MHFCLSDIDDIDEDIFCRHPAISERQSTLGTGLQQSQQKFTSIGIHAIKLDFERNF